ncbi:MAG: hypothetical protein LBI49_21185 [Nocardiopsaceae bacterium]|jgi:hypothetical protein|nr:hypothetical protein [Nocardiopsaceae bacterium]
MRQRTPRRRSWLGGWLRASWLGSVHRRWWPDRNPIRRASDRAEALLLGGLVAAFLAGAPLAGLAASHAAFASTLRTATAQRASSQQVRAVLLADAPGLLSTGSGASIRPSVPARWTTRDGMSRTGEVPAAGHAPAGSMVTVWIDRAGRLTLAPSQAGQATGQAVLAAAFTVSSVGLLLMCIGIAVRYRFDCRRMADLDAEWRAVGPHWSNRLLARRRPRRRAGRGHWQQ